VGKGEVVVITSVTGTVKDPEVESLTLSVTVTVNVESSAVTGAVPVNAPAVLRFSHVGKPVADQMYPLPDPPEAANVWLYAPPAVAAGSGDVVVITNAG
jgi:hypothetical protein